MEILFYALSFNFIEFVYCDSPTPRNPSFFITILGRLTIATRIVYNKGFFCLDKRMNKFDKILAFIGK